MGLMMARRRIAEAKLRKEAEAAKTEAPKAEAPAKKPDEKPPAPQVTIQRPKHDQKIEAAKDKARAKLAREHDEE